MQIGKEIDVYIGRYKLTDDSTLLVIQTCKGLVFDDDEKQVLILFEKKDDNKTILGEFSFSDQHWIMQQYIYCDKNQITVKQYKSVDKIQVEKGIGDLVYWID
jgi:hypothetical protein